MWDNVSILFLLSSHILSSPLLSSLPLHSLLTLFLSCSISSLLLLGAFDYLLDETACWISYGGKRSGANNLRQLILESQYTDTPCKQANMQTCKHAKKAIAKPRNWQTSMMPLLFSRSQKSQLLQLGSNQDWNCLPCIQNKKKRERERKREKERAEHCRGVEGSL